MLDSNITVEGLPETLNTFFFFAQFIIEQKKVSDSINIANLHRFVVNLICQDQTHLFQRQYQERGGRRSFDSLSYCGHSRLMQDQNGRYEAQVNSVNTSRTPSSLRISFLLVLIWPHDTGNLRKLPLLILLTSH